MSLATRDVEIRLKLRKHRGEEALREILENYVVVWTKDTTFTKGDLFMDEMEVDLHVLRALMLNEVGDVDDVCRCHDR
jgi:hypothetical protein